MVSHTSLDTAGMIFGSRRPIWRGAVTAHWDRRSSAFALTRHSGDLRASNRTGHTTPFIARGFASATIAPDRSSDASLTLPDEDDDSSKAAARNGTTKGSAGRPTISHRARRMRSDPSLPSAGVTFPFLESVRPVYDDAAELSSPALMPERLMPEAIFLIPPPAPSLNTAPIPWGRSMPST